MLSNVTRRSIKKILGTFSTSELRVIYDLSMLQAEGCMKIVMNRNYTPDEGEAEYTEAIGMLRMLASMSNAIIDERLR